MKTPDEIKSGLEYCISDVGCVGCVYYDECIDDRNLEPLQQDTIAYIRQLEADNAQQARCIENLTDKLNAAHDEVAMLQSQAPKWISVEERLPENDQMVIFIPNYYAKSIRVGTLSQVGERGGVMFDDKYVRNAMNYYARYWMQLPELPEEDA